MDSQWTHKGFTTDSQWTHNGPTKDSQRTHTKIIEKALVLQGCPRKVLFLHWFCKVVREKCCFYIGFTRVVREKPYKTCVKTTFFVDNQSDSQKDSQKDSQSDSQRTHNGLTTDSQWTHNGLTKDSQSTHNGLTPKSLKKRLFYKVVREKGCFYIGFTRLSAKHVVFA